MKHTPMPNVVIDVYFPYMTSPERDILQIIFRQTLGWKDERTTTGRKESDWISHSQFEFKTRWSRRTIVMAIQKLVDRRLIDVTDCRGCLLNSPEQRRGRQRLYYRPALWLITGKNPVEKPSSPPETCAIDALGLRKKYTSLVQQMRYTKD